MSKSQGTLLVVEEYNRLIEAKLLSLNNELDKANRNRMLYQNLILKNEDKVYPNSVIRGINKHKLKSAYTRRAISLMFKSLISINTRKIDGAGSLVTNQSEDNREIVSYYTKFRKHAYKETALENKLYLYEQLRLPKSVIKFTFKTMLNYGARYLLLGNRLQLPNNFSLIIRGKSRKKVYDKYGVPKKLKVDWAKSYETLEAIASSHSNITRELLLRYKRKEITRKDFMNSMKPYVYNKTSNPNGKKWIVPDNKDFDFWLIMWSKFSKLDNLDKYHIEPSNYISPAVVSDLGIPRKQSEFMKLVKHVDDIINTKYLGLRDKIMMLEKYDVNYCLNTFENNIE